MAVSKRLRAKFVKAAERLKSVMQEIADSDPTARLYVQEDHFHLMSDHAHDDDGKARQDRIIESVHCFPRTDCGAW